MRSALLAPLVVLAWAGTARAADLAGRVLDLTTGKPVPGAWVRALPAGAPATGATLTVSLAGLDGTFRLSGLPESAVDVHAGADGYQEVVLAGLVPGSKTPVIARLVPEIAQAGGQEMNVTAERAKIDKSPTVSSHRIEHGAVDKTPGSLEDVTRAISLKPGIVAASDFAPVLFVRGGDATQTFFFLDDVLIYNPFQPVGGGTIFNPDLVDSAEVYTGGQLASFPEALSGLISIQYKEPETDRLHAFAEASLISVNLRAEGPIDKSRGGIVRLAPDGWLVSARRSDYEPLLRAAAPVIGSASVATPLFLDLFAKTTWQLGSRDHLDLNAMAVENSLAHFTYKNADAARQDSLFFADHQKLAWMRWTRVLGETAVLKSNVSHVEDALRANSTGTDPLAVNVDSFNDAVRQDLSSAPEEGTAWDTGWYFDRARAKLVGKVGDFRRLQPNVAIGGDPNLPLTDLFPAKSFAIAGAYVQYKRTLRDALTVQPGVRLGWNDATHELNVGPRLNASLRLGEHHVLKGAWGIFSEPPINPVLLDPDFGNPQLKSERAIHYVLGYEGEPLGGRDPLWAKAEVFYKDVFDQVMPQDFSTVDFDHPSPADLEKLKHPFVNSGYSRAYGAELSLKREISGRTRVEFNYSLLRVVTTNPLIADPVNRTFAPYQDQRHTLNVVANYRWTDQWTFSATGRFGSGKPYTPVESFRVEPDSSNDLGPRDIWVPDRLGPLNSARYPAYARLDLRAERAWHAHGAKLTGYLELINAQVRRNTEFIAYTAGDPDGEPPRPPARQDIEGLPTIPYFGIRAEW